MMPSVAKLSKDESITEVTLYKGYENLPEDIKVYVPNFDYLLYDVSNYTDEEIKGIAQTRIGLTLMREVENTFPEGSDLTRTSADILREEGLQQGLQQGLKQGIQKGKTDALSETAIQLLIERFGKVPKDIKEAIVNTDPVALQLLLVNSFKFQEIDEARKYIQ